MGWLEGWDSWRDGGMEGWRDGGMEGGRDGGMPEPRVDCCVVFRALSGPWSSLGRGGHSRRRFPGSDAKRSSILSSAVVCVYEGDALGECYNATERTEERKMHWELTHLIERACMSHLP